MPIGSDREYTGTFGDLFTGYSVFAGITITLLCVVHGATFLTLKTTGELRERAALIDGGSHRSPRRRARVPRLDARRLGKGVLVNVPELIAIMAAFAAAALTATGREGWSFAATTVAMAATIASLFVELYPDVMVSSTTPRTTSRCREPRRASTR